MKKLIKYIIAWFRIPKGVYCVGCPYWRGNIAPISIGDGHIAYCKYLDKTDLDLCLERENWLITELKSKKQKPLKELYEEVDLSMGSLLWDGCKECGIKFSE